MVFLHGGSICPIEVGAVAVPAVPFAVTLFFWARYHLKGRGGESL